MTPEPDETPDVFIGGGRSITQTLRPRVSGWRELSTPDPLQSMGGVARTYINERLGLAVISAVEVAADKDGIDRGPEYHISISKQFGRRPRRCSSEEARVVLRQFGLEGAEEDNHVPFGVVRNFWRTVGTPLIGMECACKADEPAIVEDKGDFVWRP